MSENKTHLAILSIGTNLGDRGKNLDACKELLTLSGTIQKCSLIYESEGWGDATLLPFYNICLGLKTILPLYDLFIELKNIEKQLGRDVKTQLNKYENRLIDIDIIYYDERTISSEELTIPHQQMQNRMFVLKPLGEVYPELKHPILQKNSLELIKDCIDKTALKTV